MKKTVLLLCVCLIGVLQAGSQPPGNTVAFLNADVLTMEGEAVLKDQVVVVRDGKIASIGPAAKADIPAGARRVDARGKTLMPAIAEMHGHIPAGPAPDEQIEKTLFMYAVNGVGTVRGMLGDPRHLQFRERVARGALFSPRIYTSGPSLNGNSVQTVEAAIAAVTSQKAAGYDLLKIHPGLTRPVYNALATKARELKIDVAGHVPLDVGLRHALATKYRSIDHLDGYIEAMAKNPMQSQFFGINLVDEVDESKLPELVALTKEAGTWMVPTQSLLESAVNDDDPEVMARWPEMKYMPPEVIQKWIASKKNMTSKIPADQRKKFIALRRRILKALADGGVPIALGSDAPQVWNVPGFSAHRELKALTLAGLTPFQALQTGTVNVARYFGTESTTGTIAVGGRADLILLDANPLEDISNSQKIAGVMLGGKWMAGADLQLKP